MKLPSFVQHGINRVLNSVQPPAAGAALPAVTPAPAALAAPAKGKIILKSFGDAEPVLDGHALFEYGYCPYSTNNLWYDMPYDIRAVAKLFRATSHHTSAIVVKRNILTSDYIPHPLLPLHQFNALVLNLLTFSNAYAHVLRNRFGGVVAIQSRQALLMRRGADLVSYYQLSTYEAQEHQFNPGDIVHIYEPDITQDLYGIPTYLSSINSILLNEAATLFRRRYYKNGAHAGFILHLTDAMQTQEDVEELEQAMEDSKGAGNFKNMLIYTPNGKEKGIQLIPIAEVAAKDEFYNIKLASRDDQLAGHRMPPQLVGVVPQNSGGFGDIEKAFRVLYYNEIIYLQQMLMQINSAIGIEVIKFKQHPLLVDQVSKPAN